MNILLTNDDGYNAEGILLLKNKLSKYGNVVIVAPDGPMSGKSLAKTFRAPLFINRIDDNVFSCSGTPGDCVSFALFNMNINFELVVSGCNDGLNISYDTLYSGTVGACLEALVGRVKSIAFSCDNNFNLVDKYFDLVMDFVLKNNLLSDKYVLNVNFPSGDSVRGISLGTLYYRKDHYFFEEQDGGYYARRDLQTDFSDDKNSDCYQTQNGIISVVPLSNTCFNKELFKELKTKIHGN